MAPLLFVVQSAPQGGGGTPSTVVIAIIGAVALVFAAALPTLLSRSGRQIKMLEDIRNDARLHRERDDVRFASIFGLTDDRAGQPLRDPWPHWDEERTGRR